jgi:hypothetical protein
MIRVRALQFGAYKAFKRLQRVELGNLTLLTGRNSSGKSAVARFPLLLGQAFRPTSVPIDLDSLREFIDLGGSFVDLIHGRSEHGAIQVGGVFQLAPSEPPIEVLATVQNFRELMLQIVTHWQIGPAGAENPWLRLEWSGADPSDSEQQPYRGEWWHGDSSGKFPPQDIAFRGVLPPGHSFLRLQEDRLVPAALPVLPRLTELSELHRRVSYLGPFRPTPERSYRMPGGHLRHVGAGGGKAAPLLAADSLRNQGRVVDAVADWYEQNLGGWRLDVQKEGSQFALVLRSKTDRSVEINLVDTGAGMSQVLPIVVQRCLEAAGAGNDGLEIVEQPELHLHPAAHGPLADLFLEAVRRNPDRQFFIETHSENFLLRIRRRIAEGQLSRDSVRLYWVDDRTGGGSQIVPIELHDNGDVANWPEGVFSEDFEELRQIRRAQRDRVAKKPSLPPEDAS